MNACDRHSPRKQMCDCDFQPPVRPKESYPNESHLAANTHEYWIFYAETPKKSGVSGKLECVGKCAKIRIFGKNCGKNGKNNV